MTIMSVQEIKWEGSIEGTYGLGFYTDNATLMPHFQRRNDWQWHFSPI